ncbi:MAG TPA: ABC transporter ATP-binding protein [Candidatus Limnocylindrales bacterium]|nr:ABC transporter ATP-binding protein [Candidatus Limnocylindrales bacterium]
MLTIKDLSVRYPNGTLAIESLSLEIDDGEFVSVVGPSGCGKSTLLRAAAGLVPATAGSVSLGTQDIGFVFQDPTLLPWRSVLRNVELVAELRGASKADRRRMALAALEKVGLADVAKQKPRTLSGGMRMRVSLARTLATQPSVMLFDEPFGSVDELTRGRLCDDLMALFAAERFTGLLVTHSIAEAVYLGRRVLVMSERPGRLVGEVEVPLDYPRNPSIRFEAAFAELTAKVYTLLTDGAAS